MLVNFDGVLIRCIMYFMLFYVEKNYLILNDFEC